ncbi:unnamed protein product, partial [Hapterophycus canaliculatus]
MAHADPKERVPFPVAFRWLVLSCLFLVGGRCYRRQAPAAAFRRAALGRSDSMVLYKPRTADRKSRRTTFFFGLLCMRLRRASSRVVAFRGDIGNNWCSRR